MPKQTVKSISNHKKASILYNIKHLGKMRKATLSKQEFKKTDGTKQGPYYVLQGYDKHGEHYSQRIPEDMVPSIQNEINNYKKFEKYSDNLSKQNIDDSFFKKQKGKK